MLLFMIAVCIFACIHALVVGLRDALREYVVLSAIYFSSILYGSYLLLGSTPASHIVPTIFSLIILFATIVRKGSLRSKGLMVGIAALIALIFSLRSSLGLEENLIVIGFQVYAVSMLFLAFLLSHPLRNGREVILVKVLWILISCGLLLSSIIRHLDMSLSELLLLGSITTMGISTTLKKNSVIFSTKQAVSIARKWAENPQQKENQDNQTEYFLKIIRLIR